jgi:hypothetical protein
MQRLLACSTVCNVVRDQTFFTLHGERCSACCFGKDQHLR